MARGERNYHKLIVWQEAHRLILAVYQLSNKFPKSDLFGLTSQLRRSVISIANNIVEGQASNSRRDFKNFLNIANRSLAETCYLLELAKDLKYISVNEFDKLDQQCSRVGYLLNKLRKNI
jgi:four helix bundle protein